MHQRHHVLQCMTWTKSQGGATPSNIVRCLMVKLISNLCLQDPGLLMSTSQDARLSTIGWRWKTNNQAPRRPQALPDSGAVQLYNGTSNLMPTAFPDRSAAFLPVWALHTLLCGLLLIPLPKNIGQYATKGSSYQLYPAVLIKARGCQVSLL